MQREETCNWYQPTPKKLVNTPKIALDRYISYIDYCHSAIESGTCSKKCKDMTSRDMLLYASIKERKYEKGLQEAKQAGYKGIDMRAYAASFVYGAIESFEEIFRNIMSADDEQNKRKIIKIIARKNLNAARYCQKYLAEDPLFAAKVQDPFTSHM